MHRSFKLALRRGGVTLLGLCLALCACDSNGHRGAGAPSGTEDQPPPIRHVFIIVLENEDFDTTFGENSPAPFLAKTLPSMGQLLTQYFAIGHFSLDNYIAMVSGQAPNPVTQGDCQIYQDFAGVAGGPDGQAVGQGCVYPAEVMTLSDQLEAANFTWKGYMQDMGADPARESATCGHPPLNAQDKTQSASATDQYATRHDPFVYFHSIIDDQARCDAHVVNLDALPADLASAATTPNFAFITPDLCADGHDETCADGTSPGGFEGIEAFLQQWVPMILNSPAFKQDGLLIVTFDEAEGPDSDSSACCNEPTGPNTPMPGIQGPGGGRIGAVLVSPFIVAGTVNETPYNHYALLRSIENIFGLDHLGFAGQDGLKAFGEDVYNGG